MEYLNKLYNRFNSSLSSSTIKDIPQFWKSKYFYIGLAISYGTLFFVRRLFQGYYYDYKAVVSLNDLSGKTVIITGGNSGIGLGSAIHLARLNANIVIACRNQKKAEVAVQYIKKQSGNENVNYMHLDLSNMKSVKQFASKINDDNIDIDYLILNAGIMSIASSPSHPPSSDGLGLVFQTNYFGHWYLTNQLLDRIKATADKRCNVNNVNVNKYGAPVRIVAVSSSVHASQTIPLDNNAEWDAFINGGCGLFQSKLLQIIHIRKLQEILVLSQYDQKIQCVAVNPGLVRTNAIKRRILTYPILALYPLYWYITRNILMGAQTVLHVCTNDKIVNGGYYNNCRLEQSKGKNACSNDKTIWDKLWNRSEELIKTLQI